MVLILFSLPSPTTSLEQKVCQKMLRKFYKGFSKSLSLKIRICCFLGSTKVRFPCALLTRLFLFGAVQFPYCYNSSRWNIVFTLGLAFFRHTYSVWHLCCFSVFLKDADLERFFRLSLFKGVVVRYWESTVIACSWMSYWWNRWLKIIVKVTFSVG